MFPILGGLQFLIDFKAFWKGFGKVLEGFWAGFGMGLGAFGVGLGRVWEGLGRVWRELEEEPLARTRLARRIARSA